LRIVLREGGQLLITLERTSAWSGIHSGPSKRGFLIFKKTADSKGVRPEPEISGKSRRKSWEDCVDLNGNGEARGRLHLLPVILALTALWIASARRTRGRGHVLGADH